MKKNWHVINVNRRCIPNGSSGGENVPEYDFTSATGAPQKQLQSLRSLSFIERTKISYYWGHQVWQVPIWQ